MPKTRLKVKRRVPRSVQQARWSQADTLSEVLQVQGRHTLLLDAIIQAVGADKVRQGVAHVAAQRSLAALAGHVANGKLVEAPVVSSPGTCAIEISETKGGKVVTKSAVLELAAIDQAQAAKLVGVRVGTCADLGGETQVKVLRAWDVVTP
jgi:hypothetical protein